MKAQSSLEFLVFASISVLFLVAAVTFFGVRSEEASEMDRVSQMKSICHSASSKISAVFSAGSGTYTTLDLPEAVAGRDIEVFVYGASNSMVVRDGEISVGCALNIRSVSDGESSSFEIAKNASMKNVKGVVLVE